LSKVHLERFTVAYKVKFIAFDRIFKMFKAHFNIILSPDPKGFPIVSSHQIFVLIHLSEVHLEMLTVAYKVKFIAFNGNFKPFKAPFNIILSPAPKGFSIVSSHRVCTFCQFITLPLCATRFALPSATFSTAPVLYCTLNTLFSDMPSSVH
jgi:hypothetical protein